MKRTFWKMLYAEYYAKSESPDQSAHRRGLLWSLVYSTVSVDSISGLDKMPWSDWPTLPTWGVGPCSHNVNKILRLDLISVPRFSLTGTLEPQRQKTYLWTCAPSEGSDQTARIRIFTVRVSDSQGYKVSSCGQRRLIRLQMRRLIVVSIWHIWQKVFFLISRLIYSTDSTDSVSGQLRP